MVATTTTTIFVGGSIVVTGLATLVGGSGAVGSGTFSMMALGLEQVLFPC